MKKIFSTIYNIIRIFLLKNLFTYIKKRKEALFVIMMALLFFLPDLILTLPIFIANFHLPIIIYFAILLVSKIALSLIFYFKYRKRLEQINNEILDNDMILADFARFLSNDSIFCINSGIIIVFSIFLYQFVLYLISLFFGILPLQFYLNTLFIYFTCFVAIVFGMLYFNYAVNKKNKKVIIKFEDYQEFHKYGIFMTIFYFVGLYLLQFFLFKHFLKLNLMTFLYPIPTATIFAIGLNTVCELGGLYKHINLSKISVVLTNIFSSIRQTFKEKKILKILPYFKFLLPIVFFSICLIVLRICYKNIPNVSRLAVVQSLIFACFSLMFLQNKNSYNHKQVKSAFNFAIFVYFILFIITFVGLKAVPSVSQEPVDTKELKIGDLFGFFVTPITELINKLYFVVHNLYENKFTLLVVLIPICFVATFFLARLTLLLIDRLKIHVDNLLIHSLSRQDANIIYGDSISFFYFLTSLIINFGLILLLKLECPAFANFFIYLFDVFQVSSIFKLTFLTAENITLVTKIVINVIIVIIALRVVFQFLSTLLSHFVLFADEIVYLENKIYNNTVLRIPVQKINYIIVKQTAIEKLFDIGTMYIETQDKNGLIKINGISEIKQKSIILMEKIKIDLQKI